MGNDEPVHSVTVGNPCGLFAQINLHGAQLWRLTDSDGTDLLWSGDPQVWSGRAPILFPIIGSLAGGIYRYRGQTYPLPKHGFARNAMFTVIEHSDDTALLRLEADDHSRKVYPFEFQLDLRFSCGGDRLTVAVSIHNKGAHDMPFSFGFHPALRWPIEPGAERADHVITFAAPEPAPIARLDRAGLVIPKREASPVDEDTLVLRDDLFVDDALMFTQLASRSVDYGATAGDGSHGRHIQVDFTNLPMLGIWTKPGAGYICIEPWQGLADPEGFSGDIFAKPGIIALGAGAAWRADMTLTRVKAA